MANKPLPAADIPSTLGATTFSGNVTIQTGGQLKFGDSSYEVSRSDSNSSFMNYSGGIGSDAETAAVIGLNGKTRSGEWAGGAYLLLATGASAPKFAIRDKNSVFQFQVDANGVTLPATKTPASASATGVTGNIAWDASYIYICTATDTWKRVAIATFIPVTKTASYTAALGDPMIVCNHATVPVVITLPAATGTGNTYQVKNIGAASASIARAGSDVIDGATSLALVQYASATICDLASGIWGVV